MKIVIAGGHNEADFLIRMFKKQRHTSLVVINAENTRGKLISDELNANGITAVSTAGNGNITVKVDDGYITAYR